MLTGRSLALALLAASLRPAADARVAEFINLQEFGAKGDGRTDDKAAIQAAVDTGKSVRCRVGSTYVTEGGIVSSAAGQQIDFTGCTVKLKDGARSRGILRLTGAGSRVNGGTWDLNAANNRGRNREDDGGYNIWAVEAAGDHQTVEGASIRDSEGLCIKALGANDLTVRMNRLQGCRAMAVYVDGSPARDTTDIVVEDNRVEFQDLPTGTQGIGVYSKGSHRIRRIRVSDNTILGPLSDSDGTNVGITVRGTESLVHGNVVRGTTIAISVDQGYSQDCAISENNIAGANGGTAYGIEINGGHCTIANNVIEGGRDGIAGSVSSGVGTSLDDIVVSGNVLKNQTTRGIYLLAGAGHTAHHVAIVSNIIEPGPGAAAVYLQGDCRYALISGNVLRGPGSGVTRSRGVYLDGVNSDVRIQGNCFSGWLRAVTLYNAGPVAQARMVFDGNDVSVDMPHVGTALLNLEGSATYGTGVQITNNFTGSRTEYREDFYDVGTGVSFRVGNVPANPEGALSAGPGSVWISTNPGQPNSMFVKQVGRGSTGWYGVTGLRATVAVDLAAIPANTCAPDETASVTGASAGATCFVGMPQTTPANLQGTCFVSAPDTVKLRVCNNGPGAQDPPPGTYAVSVFN